MNKLKTLGQKRSAFALDNINALIHKSPSKEFKNFIVGAPNMVLQNGFGQSLAFWASKGEHRHKFILKCITEWLKINDITKSDDYKILLSEISNNFDQNKYLYAQDETVAMLEWLKRYAKAFLGGNDE